MTARLGEPLAWWLVLLAAWTATLGALSIAELTVGAAVAACGAAVAVAGRRALRQDWSVPLRWLRWLGPLALSVPADTARLALQRPTSGRLRSLPVPAAEPESRAAARRALGTLVLSTAPGSYLVDWPPDGAPVVHTLVSGRPRLDREVVR